MDPTDHRSGDFPRVADLDHEPMTVACSVPLVGLAAVFEIGGAWLVRGTVREGRSWWCAGLGVLALGVDGFVATLQPDASFGASWPPTAGVMVAGSLLWATALVPSGPLGCHRGGDLPARSRRDHVRAAAGLTSRS